MEELDEIISSPCQRTRKLSDVELKNIEHAVDIKTKLDHEKNTWTSCCITTDKRFVVFISQFIISVMVLGFSMYMLIVKDSCDNQVYVGLISMTIGLYIPQPKVKDN